MKIEKSKLQRYEANCLFKIPRGRSDFVSVDNAGEGFDMEVPIGGGS